MMSGDDGRPPADDSAPGDDAGNPHDDSPTGGSDSGGGRSDDGRRTADERPRDDTGDGGTGGESTGGDDAAPNGGRVGDDGTDTTADRGPTPTRARRTDRPDGNVLDRFLHDDHGPFLFLREVLSSVGAVVAVGLVLFAVSGVWPPMVAVESGSMEPHMTRGDLVFITNEGRYMPNDATFEDTGVVTAARGEEVGYRSFGGYGSVVVYDSPGRFGPPIIHRARFWVEGGENWYDEANPEYLNADNCQELSNCPAPHAGFITKGDANPSYDQAMDISKPVKPEWINGVARVKVPFLGWIRLLFSEGFAAVLDGPGATIHAPSESAWSVESGPGTDASVVTVDDGENGASARSNADVRPPARAPMPGRAAA